MRAATPVLDGLHARADEIARSRAGLGGSKEAHAAIVLRLGANRRTAEAQGWTACGFARDGGMGRLRMLGVPPGGVEPTEVPDGG
jgi:hypothetical protein